MDSSIKIWILQSLPLAVSSSCRASFDFGLLFFLLQKKNNKETHLGLVPFSLFFLDNFLSVGSEPKVETLPELVCSVDQL